MNPIIILTMILLFITITVMNYVTVIKRHERIHIKIMTALTGILIFLLIFPMIRITARDYDRYNIYGTKIFERIIYEKTVDDYYCFRKSTGMFTAENIAVNKNEVKLPWLIKYSEYVIFFCEKGYSPDKEIKLSDGRNYLLYENSVKKIDMEYSDIRYSLFILISAALFLYDLFLISLLDYRPISDFFIGVLTLGKRDKK